MEQQVDQFKLRPFANMLDGTGATATAYGVPRQAPSWLVVIDGEGKMAYNASKGWHWSSGPNAGKYVHQTQLEASLQRSPGILRMPELPAELLPAAHYYDLQQLQLVEPELRKAEGKQGSWVGRIRERIDQNRKDRLQQIDSLTYSDPLLAYREAQSFVAAFPQAPEKATVQEIVKKVLSIQDVKKELAAEEAFQRMLAPELKKVTTFKQFQARIPALLQAFLASFGQTKFAEVAKGTVEMTKKAVP